MLENYSIIDRIGKGAFGIVYLYKRNCDLKLVAIKEITFEPTTQEECDKIDNEVKVLGILKHPNIVEYYESFIETKTMYIVMEYAPGGSLHNYLQSREKNYLNEEDILPLFSQLCLGIQHIHEQNILHRDLKSQNVMLDISHKIVKIGDFGISKILNSKSKAETVVGTPCYLSPELCQGKPYNQKSDIWALGCILYEMMALERAFEAETIPALISKIMIGNYKPLMEEYSAELKKLLSSMLHKDPAVRVSINQVISNPIVFPKLFELFTDLGMIRKCSKTIASEK